MESWLPFGFPAATNRKRHLQTSEPFARVGNLFRKYSCSATPFGGSPILHAIGLNLQPSPRESKDFPTCKQFSTVARFCLLPPSHYLGPSEETRLFWAASITRPPVSAAGCLVSAARDLNHKALQRKSNAKKDRKKPKGLYSSTFFGRMSCRARLIQRAALPPTWIQTRASGRYLSGG